MVLVPSDQGDLALSASVRFWFRPVGPLTGGGFRDGRFDTSGLSARLRGSQIGFDWVRLHSSRLWAIEPDCSPQGSRPLPVGEGASSAFPFGRLVHKLLNVRRELE